MVKHFFKLPILSVKCDWMTQFEFLYCLSLSLATETSLTKQHIFFHFFLFYFFAGTNAKYEESSRDFHWKISLAWAKIKLSLRSVSNSTAMLYFLPLLSIFSSLSVSCCWLARLLTLRFFLSSLPPSPLLSDWRVTVLRLSSVTRHCWPAESSGVNSTGRSESTCAVMMVSCRPVAGACRLALNRYATHGSRGQRPVWASTCTS